MRRRPLGCLSATALLFALAATLLLVGAAVVTGNGIFSPGPLNAEPAEAPLGDVRSHADLSGDCSACHTAAWSGETMADRCLGCHATVGDELAAGTGLHGRFATTGDCRSCHTDHRGSTASLTLANPTSFPHEKTGYSLAAHPVTEALLGTRFACADCHTRSVSEFDPTTCATCHGRLDAAYMTAHTDAFGSDCRACHDGIDSYGARFEHTTWALEGRHADATCAGCHQGARDLATLRATSTDCAACHVQDDAHGGRLGTDCASCHTAAGWQDATDGFDHGKTAFTLTGKHMGVDCLACHVNRQWTGIGTTCEACHGGADDPHGGQFKGSCAGCHSTDGWDDVTFDHATTGFALRDSHAKVECEACHVAGRYAGTPTRCFGCHEADDEHEGNLGTGCEACHRATGWKDTTFDHQEIQFKLTGMHDLVPCSSCHRKLTEYRGTPSTCYACHKADDVHDGGMGTDCSSCHGTKSWKDATFDHSRTDFPLTGAHANTRCAACHTDSTYGDTPTACIACHKADDAHGGALPSCARCHTAKGWVPSSFDHGSTGFRLTGAHATAACTGCHKGNDYTGTPSTCYACHKADDHHDGAYGTSCGTCHSTKSWSGASIDHDKTDFPLTGAHKSVSCGKCHVDGVYQGTPKACNACHTKPDTHEPNAFSGCNSCHSTSGWKPADFNAPHSFPMSHRNAGGVCSKCHPSTWASYSCASCHSNASMDEHHKDVPNYSRSTCAVCHPNGKGD